MNIAGEAILLFTNNAKGTEKHATESPWHWRCCCHLHNFPHLGSIFQTWNLHPQPCGKILHPPASTAGVKRHLRLNSFRGVSCPHTLFILLQVSRQLRIASAQAAMSLIILFNYINPRADTILDGNASQAKSFRWLFNNVHKNKIQYHNVCVCIHFWFRFRGLFELDI